MRRALVLFALAGSVIAVATGARPQAFDPAVDRGLGVAERRCAECHAIRSGRDSADGDAPSFWVLRLRYNEISLARRIASVTRGEHGGMPPIPLTEADRRDLVSYIESLSQDNP